MKGGNFTYEEICEIVYNAKELGVKYIYTGHCTGDVAYTVLKEAAGDMVQALTSGMVIHV